VTAHERYWRILLGVAPRLWSLLDRERASPTRGSFDRVNWGWKFRDFPLTMWQATLMPLGILYRTPHPDNPYALAPRVAEWIATGLEHTIDRQHRNGAFDSFTPFSQDHGVTLAMVLTLCTTAQQLQDALAASLTDRLRESVSRACRFAASSDEDYAFINNHQAAFVLAYRRAARLLDDASLHARADAVLSEILRRQSRDGWFEEYGGPDPGYETFGLTYLALAERERPDPRTFAALERSVEFLSHCVHPDGSIGGNYGSRNTGQYAPGGLELLAGRSPLAGAVAEFVGSRLDSGGVVTPLSSDDDNLPLLTFSYAVAAVASGERSGAARPLLPCERRDVLTRFHDSGFVVASTQRYFAVTNLSKGGAIRVFDRESSGLVYEDGGYLLRTREGDWSSQLPGESVPSTSTEGGTVETTARFSAVRRELLTPAKFLVLRILNLTVFRSVRLGAFVRRMIIARLITGRERGPWTLSRSVTFEADRVVLHDEVVPDGAGGVTFASLERTLLPIHMGSAKYFHTSDLADLHLPKLAGWEGALSGGRSAALTQVLGFAGAESTHEVRTGDPVRTHPRERTTA